ncbi:MAG: NAD(P)-dependent oxidoreductase [Bacteriovorax sp.]|nr:NAD(P)-dependent oxidoreductase [Bacteriovorax sp.]
MNILITGGTGFIGKALTKRLLDEGNTLLFTTRENDPDNKSINLAHSTHHEVTSFFERHQIDGIIHLASLVLVTHSPDDIKNLIESNITFPTLLLEAAREAKIKWFINTGTFWQHYNNEEYNPVNLYAATKQAFEDILKYYSEISTIQFLTLEVSDTFGPDDTRGKIFNKWMNAKNSNEEINMSPGNQMIDILYIDDVIDAFRHSIDRLQNNKNKLEKFSLYSRKPISLREVSATFDTVFNSQLKINWGKLPYREREVMQTWSKGLSLPGWKPKKTFDQGCEEIKKLIKS